MIHAIIEEKLRSAFEPKHLEVLNESYMHNVPKGSESHFKVIIVSQAFENLRLVARHRKVNGVLIEELENHIHALSIHTYTESEWLQQTDGAPESPMCLGGSKLG